MERRNFLSIITAALSLCGIKSANAANAAINEDTDEINKIYRFEKTEPSTKELNERHIVGYYKYFPKTTPNRDMVIINGVISDKYNLSLHNENAPACILRQFDKDANTETIELDWHNNGAFELGITIVKENNNIKLIRIFYTIATKKFPIMLLPTQEKIKEKEKQFKGSFVSFHILNEDTVKQYTGYSLNQLLNFN